jgi:hypothetical protein
METAHLEFAENKWEDRLPRQSTTQFNKTHCFLPVIAYMYIDLKTDEEILQTLVVVQQSHPTVLMYPNEQSRHAWYPALCYPLGKIGWLWQAGQPADCHIHDPHQVVIFCRLAFRDEFK